MKTIREFERSWPLLPATGGVGSDAIRVLLELHQHMPVVSPLAEGTRASPMNDDMKKVSYEIMRDMPWSYRGGCWVGDSLFRDRLSSCSLQYQHLYTGFCLSCVLNLNQ